MMRRISQILYQWRKVLVSTVLLLLLALAYPFQSTVVPEWNLQVVDDAGSRVSGINVTEHWQHYLLENAGHEEVQTTGGNGQVTFPARTIRANLFSRTLATVSKFGAKGGKARRDPYASVVLWGSKNHQTTVAVYEPGTVPSARITVPRSK